MAPLPGSTAQRPDSTGPRSSGFVVTSRTKRRYPRMLPTRTGWLGRASMLLMLMQASPVDGTEPQVCPPGFNDSPAMRGHMSQADIASGKLTFPEVFDFGRRLFITNFN